MSPKLTDSRFPDAPRSEFNSENDLTNDVTEDSAHNASKREVREESETDSLNPAQSKRPSLEEAWELTASAPSSETPKPSSPKRRWLWGFAGLLGLLGLGSLTYFRVILPRLSTRPPQFGPLQVTLETPTSALVDESADYVATLDSRASTTIQPESSGRITQVFVKAGDRVKAGAPLMQLDAARQEAQVFGRQAAVDAAAAEINVAQAEITSARRTLDALRATRASRQADLAFQKGELDRFQALYDQGATSLQTLQERKKEWQRAEAILAEAEAQMQAQDAVIARAEATLARSRQQRDEAIATVNQEQVNLRNFTVRAPFDGVVGEIPAKAGNVVNESTALLTLTENRNLEVNIEVPQERSDRLQLGLPVQLIQADGKAIASGAVSFISPNVNPDTQSIQVKAQFQNAAGELRTNQFVKARIVWANRRGVLIPTTAISRLAGQNFAFVAQPYGESECSRNGSAERGPTPKPDQLMAVQVPIQLGRIVKNSQDVTEGLKLSDRIISSGLLQLQHCTPIQAAS